jgi:Cytochrome P460
MNKFLIVITAAILLVATHVQAKDLATETFSAYVSKTGEITLPENFRKHWVHLGSWVVTDAKAPGHGFHDVYTQPDAAKGYAKTGKFPDGTVLVKEIRKLGSGKMTTGEAQWATDNAVWFVMVKDSKSRFKGNPNWGEGWGWALFEAKNPKLNTAKSYIESCLGCHTPAQATDWVFVQGYPTIRLQ